MVIPLVADAFDGLTEGIFHTGIITRRGGSCVGIVRLDGNFCHFFVRERNKAPSQVVDPGQVAHVGHTGRPGGGGVAVNAGHQSGPVGSGGECAGGKHGSEGSGLDHAWKAWKEKTAYVHVCVYTGQDGNTDTREFCVHNPPSCALCVLDLGGGAKQNSAKRITGQRENKTLRG